MAPPARTDPLRNFRFHVIIDKELNGDTTYQERMGFMSVSGLSIQNEVIQYREGGDNTTTRKLPGQSDFPPIQLQHGLFDASYNGHASWYWFKEIFFHATGRGYAKLGNNFRTNIIINLYDHPYNDINSATDRHLKVSWKIHNAWPSSLAFSDLDAGGNSVAVQQLTLVHEGLDVRFGRGNSEPTPW